jgi:TatD DNase family protein
MAPMELIDTHCHIDVAEFGSDRGKVLGRAREQGVRNLVVPGIHAATWSHLLAVCREHEGLLPALGLHPIYMEHHRVEDIAALEGLIARERPVAIGEIGLDFYIDNPDRRGQERLLEAQLCVARDAGLPVLLHIRKAHDHVLKLLRRIRPPGGFAHAFNGSRQQAEQFIDLGFRLGFGGVVTFDGARKIRALASELPLTSVVLETDAPDLPPSRHRNERNSPEYLPEVVAALSELRGEEAQHIAAVTTANAREVLALR